MISRDLEYWKTEKKNSGASPLAPMGRWSYSAPQTTPQLICSFATLSRCDASRRLQEIFVMLIKRFLLFEIYSN